MGVGWFTSSTLHEEEISSPGPVPMPRYYLPPPHELRNELPVPGVIGNAGCQQRGVAIHKEHLT